ncbi:MAG: Crp/Fnr family transcriptional regulator [Pyrinomonadaceae bacterium]
MRGTAGDEERLTLASVFRDRAYRRIRSSPHGASLRQHQTIYNIGDEARSLFYLRSGLVKLEAVSGEGRGVILNMCKPGELFGELSLCDGRRNEMAVTMESSEVVEIGVEEVVGLLHEKQGAMLLLLRSVCRRLADSYRVIQEYSFDNLPERLAKTLMRLADEIGRETPRGTELTHYITQEELAQMLSVRREIVSSELSRLRARGCVSYLRRGRLVINRAALAAYADSLGRAAALGLSVTFGLSVF